MVDWASGTGILHGNRSSIIYTPVHTGVTALDDFQFTMAIRTGQYTSLDIITFIWCFIKLVNRDKGVLFLSKVRHGFLIVVTLHCFFAYQFHNNQKSYQGKNVSHWVPLKVNSSMMLYYYN